MIVVDSITLAMQRGLVDVVDGHFLRTTAPNGSLVKMIAKPDFIGINTIEVRPDIVRVDVSAKILLEQYSEGINVNTIDRVLDTINKSGIIKMNSNNLIDYQVHKCDFVANFHTDKPHLEYYNALNIIYNPRYRNAIYENICRYGFAFIGKQSGHNKYMKFYSKWQELNKACNKKFVENIGMERIMSHFQDVIRIEFRAISHEQIRAYSQIDNNNLKSLLFSNCSPLYKIFCEIVRSNSIKQNKLLLLSNIATTKDVDDILLQFGYSSWLNMFGHDLDSALSPIRQILKASKKHKSDTSRKLKRHKEAFQKVLSPNMTLVDNRTLTDRINEIKTFLLN